MAGDKQKVTEGASIVSTPADLTPADNQPTRSEVLPVCDAVNEDGNPCTFFAGHLAAAISHVWALPPAPSQDTATTPGGQATS